jgi:hypothetical protein
MDELANNIILTTIIFMVVVGVITIAIIFFAMRGVRGMMSGMGGRFIPPKLMENGISAQAQITQITQTNMLVNRNPVALIDLSVQPPNGQPYPVRVRRVVSMFQIMQFQPGATVPVMIDPDDPQNVVITL